MAQEMLECPSCGKKAMVTVIYDKTKHSVHGLDYKTQEKIEEAQAQGRKVGVAVCNNCTKGVICYFE